MLLDTLGAGGVAQQIRATDQKGMTLLMHVARFAGSVEVFSSALHLVKTLTSRQQGLCHLRARDAEGRTLVHHAAEGRTEEMLPKVRVLRSARKRWVSSRLTLLCSADVLSCYTTSRNFVVLTQHTRSTACRLDRLY